MRIPAEALALYRPDGSRAFLDSNGAKPVAGSARIGSALPKTLPQRPVAGATEGDRDDGDAPQAPVNSRANRRENQGGNDRQHDQGSGDGNAEQSGDENGSRPHDRRQEDRPVLIDTRLGRARRQSDRAIDITV